MSRTMTADPAGDLSRSQMQLLFGGLVLGMLLSALDQSIVAPALPVIVRELGGFGLLSWVIVSNLLASTIATPLWGKFGDLFGRKPVFQTAIGVFLVGAFLSGLAQNMAQLIAFRALQGLGGGGLMVLGQAAIADVASPRERGKYQGYLAAAFGSATVAGPLVGGFFTDHLSWRWAFSVNMPFGIAALIVTSIALPAGRGRERPVVDYFGAVLLTPAIAGVVLLTSWGGNRYSWGSPVILGIIAGTVVLVTAFIAVERRTAEPLLPPRLFKVSVVSFSASVSFLYGVALFGVITFLPLFLQLVSGTSATGSGLVMAPMLVSLSIASAVAGRFISQIGRYKAFPVIGTATTAALFLLDHGT